jgi:hypothetical protein
MRQFELTYFQRFSHLTKHSGFAFFSQYVKFLSFGTKVFCPFIIPFFLCLLIRIYRLINRPMTALTMQAAATTGKTKAVLSTAVPVAGSKTVLDSIILPINGLTSPAKR